MRKHRERFGLFSVCVDILTLTNITCTAGKRRAGLNLTYYPMIMNEELEQILDEGRELIDELELDEKVDEWKTEAELLIRKHPIQSVLLSAAAGFLLAKILRR